MPRGVVAIGWTAVFLACALACACGDSKSGTSATTSAAPLPAPAASPASAPAIVATSAPAAPVPDENAIVVSGPIIVEHQVDVMAQRDGMLAKIFFDAPVHVKSGTVLARLDDRQLVANLEAARAKSRSIDDDLKNWQAETEVLKADYVRQQRLWDLGLTTQEQLEHAKYKAESDQWDVKRVTELLNNSRQEELSLELELEKMKITAPFDGVIARRYVREGQSVTKGERLFWVTAEAPLLMRFTLTEKYFGRLRQGESVEVTSADAAGEKHTARVKEISPVVDPSSGTFEVLVELVGERGSLRPGMNANVRLDSRR
jgi:membrane fusion protein, multidrug efflux system